jgi:hypothetical protein
MSNVRVVLWTVVMRYTCSREETHRPRLGSRANWERGKVSPVSKMLKLLRPNEVSPCHVMCKIVSIFIPMLRDHSIIMVHPSMAFPQDLLLIVVRPSMAFPRAIFRSFIIVFHHQSAHGCHFVPRSVSYHQSISSVQNSSIADKFPIN